MIVVVVEEDGISRVVSFPWL